MTLGLKGAINNDDSMGFRTPKVPGWKVSGH
jgi:hypothetical protein